MSTEVEAIHRLMTEYCFRLDAGDMQGMARLFEHGSFHVVGDPKGPRVGREAVLDLLRQVTLYEGAPKTLHVLTNVQIEPDAAGNSARAQSYIIVFQAVRPDFPMQAIFGGHYRDRFMREAGNWRFVSREITPVLVGDMSRHRTDMV